MDRAWIAVIGAALIVAVLRDVFQTILHPSGSGRLSVWVLEALWRLTGRLRGRSVAGPAGTALVIALWAGALIVGWALLYWPAMPGAFTYAPGLEPTANDDFLDALYVSWVTQTTLGYGDITPESDVLRLLAPLQATVGFGILTAAVTWVLSVYPALIRRRAAASLVHRLTDSHRGAAIPPDEVHPPGLARQMERLADALTTSRIDLIHYPATFYFEAPDRSMSLAAGLPQLRRLLSAGGWAEEVRPAASELGAALDEFLATVAADRLRLEDADTDRALDAYWRHHALSHPTG